jgi:hypothetical protein
MFMPRPAFEIDDFSVDSQDLYRRVIKHELVKEQLHTLWANDRQTHVHSLRVARIVAEFASSGLAEFSEEDAESTVRSAVLHDIGKLGVSRYALYKQDELNSKEWADIRRHPAIGFHTISGACLVRCIKPYDAIPILRHHSLQANDYPSFEVQSGIVAADVDLTPDDLTDEKATKSTVMIAVADHLDTRYPAQDEGIHPCGSKSKRKFSVDELPQEVRESFVQSGKIHKLGQYELLDNLLTLSQDTFLSKRV